MVRVGSGAGPSVLLVEPNGKEPVDAKEVEESIPECVRKCQDSR
jgi:hypothetical protein